LKNGSCIDELQGTNTSRKYKTECPLSRKEMKMGMESTADFDSI